MRRCIGSIILFLALISSLPVSAQRSGRIQDPTLNRGDGLTVNRKDLLEKKNSKQDRKSRQVDLYMFAASYSLVDSLLFISDVQKVNDVTLNNKWFLVDRSKFEAQYADFLGAEFNETLISVVYFSEKEKKMIRKRAGVLKRNGKKIHYELELTPEFLFSKPEQSEDQVQD